MKIKITPGFAAFIMFLLLFCGENAMLFLAALLVHEAGHVAACYLLGGRCGRFCLRFADCEIETAGLGYGAEALCAAAGPVINVCLFFLLRRLNPYFSAINLLLAAYNLLPVWPLDGARCLFCLLCTGLKPDTAWALIRLGGLIICSILLIFALVAGIVWKLGLWPSAAALLLFSRLALAAGRENSCIFGGSTIE